jgi:ribosomal protein S18 acetylase RimI-like enzyme
MEAIIEKAIPEDALELIEVQNLSFLEDFEKYGECPSYQEKLEDMINMIKTAIVYKIIVDDKMIGDIIVRKRDDGSYYLRTISIIPSYQSFGIGTKAIKFIEKDNSDGEVWSLITPEGSYRNRHFYEKLGYKKIGERRQSDRLTLIQYQKDL